ncbi:bromodomain and WD repeat-containing protein 3-like [Daphnia carinata]|uniref:bromodomain and WD repeat-containing protein 3-like n=1 Tax=Daphnia carinata TaxID=120202 RepID=UPI00257B4DCB|nr:bromodomain and WD repeat-containing protein 3-like [Daphnia carinata]
MDIKPFANQSDGPSSVTAELYFLIARLLSHGPCRNASEALQRELEIHGLLPKRIDWLGNEHDQTYAQVCQNFSHIGSNHLLEVCRRLGPLVDKEVPTNVRGVHSLLGAGRQSILRRKENQVRKLHREHYVIRQNKKPRLFPHDITHPPNAVSLLFGREFTGSFDQRAIAPAKLYSRVQLFCRTLGHLSAVYCVLFDRTGQYIFTGADDLLIKIWSVVTGRLLSTLRGAAAEIADLAVSCDNSLLAAGSCDKIVRVWCLRTTAPIAVLTGHGGTITSINFCPADRGSVHYLASTSSDGSVSFWEYVKEPGQTPKFFPRPHKFNEKIRPGQAQMLCASFSPGGMFMATGCADHHVRVYAMFGQEGPERILEQEAHSDRVDSIQWANTGLRFISGSKDGTALIWRYEKQEWRTVRLRMTCRLEGAASATAEELSQKLKVTMVTWSRDDRWLITAVSDFSIKVWDSSSGILRKELRGHEGEAFVLEPHPYDPNVLLSAGHDGRLLIWDMTKGEVMKSFLNFIEGQGHGAVFDAKWNPSGSTIAATDSHGHLSIYGIGPSESFKKLPKAIFFHTDYRPLIRDAHHHVLDEQTQLAPHLMPPPFLVDSEGNPYPPHMQRLVPGRENLKDDQLVPTVVVNANGEQEILAGVEMPVPPGAEVANNPPVVVSPPQFAPQRTRSNIDQMIAELAQQQERQRNRPRSSTTAAAAAASGTNSSTSSVPPNSDHSYTSRTPHTVHNRPLLVASGSTNSPRASVTPDPALNEADAEAAQNDDSVNLSTEATASESLPGFSRRIIVKPLTVGQLASIKNERQGCADEEVTLFYQEVQRKSPNIFLNTSVSPGITALLAARSRGVSDDGWSPSRPRRAHPSRPARTFQRERNVVPSPARSRMPPVSPARRTSAVMAPPQQPNQQHNYRTRANRTTNGTRDRIREGASDGTRERSRRVVRRVVSTDEDEEVDIEVEERRTNRRTSPRDEDSGDEEETRRTRSNARQRPQTRNGDALSTSDSDDSESESDLASDLLDSDDSDSETRGSSSSSSSEYSDWTAEAGVNLEPPKRTRKKVYRRPRCLSSEEETTTASTSAQPANAEAEEGEGSQPGPKKRRAPIPKAGSGGLDRIPESFRPSEWLSSVVPRRQPFYPQMGDEVIYFRQGHEQYVDAINQKKLFDLNPRSLPWSSQTIREQELVKIIGIKYEIKPPRLCCLKLGLMDPATGVLTGESFTLKYHDVADVLDFLVLRQNYELAIQRNWQPGDRFRSIIDDLWWEGQLETREPFQPQCPDSMFLCYRIRWDNDEVDRLSPWDLEKIDLERRPTSAGTGVPVIPAEIAMTLYQPRAEDWPPGGDRDSECDRIAAGISQVMGLAIAEPFAAPVDLNLYPSYAYVVEYPMDLSTIKARLENRFYRRVTAVQYDVRYVFTNACKFNEPKSDIVRSASIISDLCLEIIRNRDSVDATALYHQLVEKYKIRDEGAHENATAGPSTSKGANTKKNESAPNTPNTRSRSRRNSEHTNSESDDDSSKAKGKNGTDSVKSKEKKINTRIAKAAALSWKQQCRDLLEMLYNSEDGGPFREPVSILEVPDYLQVIDHPMDLLTVREQLQVSNYATPMDFAKDVRLIFENSKNFNTNKKSRIYAMTVRLSAVFEEHIRNILASYKYRKNTGRKSKSPHSKGTKSRKGKSLAPPNAARGTKQENGVEPPRENIKIVLSRVSKGQIVVQPSSSTITTDAGVGSARRRILEEDEPGASNHTVLPNGNSLHTSEDIDVKPGPSGLSASALAPTTNGLGKRGPKRRIVSDDDYEEEEDDDDHEATLLIPKEESSLGSPDQNKSQEDLTKGKALKKRDASAVLRTGQEESSSEDEKPISQRRRLPVAKVPVPVVKEEDVRPSSSSSNSSSVSKGNSSNSGSLCEDGSSLRRSGRARRKPKRPFDSEPSENEEKSPALAEGRKNQPRAVRTRNGGKRTVRYREDSEDEAKKRNSRQTGESKGNSSRLARKANSDNDDDDDDHENEDPIVKKQENGSIKRCSRQSAQEASKRLRTDLATSSDDDDVPSIPTYAVSSRGRLRKIINHSHQDSYSE